MRAFADSAGSLYLLYRATTDSRDIYLLAGKDKGKRFQEEGAADLLTKLAQHGGAAGASVPYERKDVSQGKQTSEVVIGPLLGWRELNGHGNSCHE